MSEEHLLGGSRMIQYPAFFLKCQICESCGPVYYKRGRELIYKPSKNGGQNNELKCRRVKETESERAARLFVGMLGERAQDDGYGSYRQ